MSSHLHRIEYFQRFLVSIKKQGFKYFLSSRKDSKKRSYFYFWTPVLSVLKSTGCMSLCKAGNGLVCTVYISGHKQYVDDLVGYCEAGVLK